MKKLFTKNHLLGIAVFFFSTLFSIQDTNAQCVNQGGGACGWSGPSTPQINNNIAGLLVPPCGSFASVGVGSGTYTYWAGCQGDNYTFSTVGSTGSTTDSKLTVYWNNGSAWVAQRWNDDDGPDGTPSTLSSLCWTNPNASSGNYLIVFNQYSSGNALGTGCGGWVSGETSALLKYRNNGPDKPGTPTGAGTFCGTATLTRAADPPYASVVYYWQTSTSGTSTANSAATQVVTTLGTTTWYVRPYNTCSGCWGTASDGVSVTIQSTANNPGTITAPAQICVNGSGSITNVTAATTGSPASSGPNYYYYWQRTSAPVVGWTMYEGPTTNLSSALPAAVTGTPGTYLLTRNSAFGCAGESSAPSLDLTVNAQPTITTAPAAVCDNTTAGFVSDISVTWSTNAGTIVAGPATTTTLTPPGLTPPTQNQNVTVTATNGLCTASAVIRTDNNTTATAGSDQTKCNDPNFILAANNTASEVTGSTGLWTCTSGCGASWGSTSVYNTTYGAVTANTTSVIRWTTTNGVCTNFDEVALRNDAQPSISGTAALCDLDGTAAFNNSGGFSVNWSIPSGGSVSPATGTSTTLTMNDITPPTQNATPTLTATNGTCTATLPLTISNATLFTSSSGSLCVGETRTLTADVTGTTFSGAGGAASGTFTAPDPFPSVSANYNIFANNGPITCRDQQTITVYSVATFTSSSADMCQGQTRTLSATPASGLFSCPAYPSAVSGFIFTAPTPATAFEDIEIRYQFLGSPCYSSQFIRVYRNPTMASITTSPLYACGLTSPALGGNTPTFGTGTWTQFSGPGTSTFSSVNSGSSNATVSTSGSYVFTWTIANGVCASTTADVTVDFVNNPSPTAGNAVGCQSYTIPNITASVGGGETVDWYANASGGLPLATGSTSFATGQTAPATYTYYAEARNTTTGCLSATRTAVTLTINPKANIAAGPDLQTCVSTPISVPGGNASASDFGGFYVWTVGVGVGSISNEGTLTPTFTPDPSDAGTTVTLDFTTDDPDGAGPCPTETDAMNIFVDALPTTADAGSDIFDCLEDLVVTLGGNTPSVGTGAWSGSATFAQGTTPNSTAEVASPGTYTYTWTITNGVCTSSDDVTVSYNNPLPITMTNGATGSCVVNDFADHHIFDANNNIIASINSNGQNLGSVSVTVNILGSPSEVANNIVPGVCGNSFTAFMGRNFDIVPDNQPSTRVDVKLYFTDSEFTALQAKAIANNNGDLCDEDDDVAFISKVHVTKYPTGNGPGGPDGTYIENSGDGQDFGANYIQVGVSSFSSFYLHGSASSAPLPVELINFTATAINSEYIHLDWATALEINNDGFELQRSTDAQNWTNIAWINGNDNSTTAKFYSHNDMQVAQNITHYYRLKQIDNDGQFEYSNIVNATLTGSNSSFNVLEFVPNPTVDMTTLLISSGVSQDIKVVIYNSIGQEVQTGNHTLNIGMNQIKFDVNLLSAGTYMATVTSGNEIRTKRLVIGR